MKDTLFGYALVQYGRESDERSFGNNVNVANDSTTSKNPNWLELQHAEGRDPAHDPFGTGRQVGVVHVEDAIGESRVPVGHQPLVLRVVVGQLVLPVGMRIRVGEQLAKIGWPLRTALQT